MINIVETIRKTWSLILSQSLSLVDWFDARLDIQLYSQTHFQNSINWLHWSSFLLLSFGFKQKKQMHSPLTTQTDLGQRSVVGTQFTKIWDSCVASLDQIICERGLTNDGICAIRIYNKYCHGKNQNNKTPTGKWKQHNKLWTINEQINIEHQLLNIQKKKNKKKTQNVQPLLFFKLTTALTIHFQFGAHSRFEKYEVRSKTNTNISKYLIRGVNHAAQNYIFNANGKRKQAYGIKKMASCVWCIN